ncbi:MAG: 6-carboxytetrahydropterin synthase, partial [Candidatus Kapabacteria bacterium]|nr:6-carboxytetrahydropterin synthase [Candidatus Kapabacteria bacterium]
MKTKIAKNFDWEMSHRLPNHDGLCRNIHGHSYKMRVELEGEPNKQSMVIDYYDMKLVISPLLEKLDHCF